MVLVQPRRGVSTKKAFEGLDIPNLVHPNIDLIKQSLNTNDYPTFIHSIDNSLETKAISLVPEIQRLKDNLMELGCDKSMMTGSGSVVMGFSQNEEVINNCIRSLRKQVRFVRKTKIL
jgi:4-diphosphocytidyl-2-C-methyl-D-erythritol kinase